MLFFSVNTPAQMAECEEVRKVEAKAMNELSWRQLNAIYEDVGDERYDDAFNDLRKMLGRAGRDSYLEAILNQALGQVEWARENYDEALGYFEKAVGLDTLPNQTHFALMYQLAQLYYMKERYDKALDRLDLWFCQSPEENITAEAWVLKAYIHAVRENYSEAQAAIERAIAVAEDAREAWYQLKLVTHFELKQYPEAAETLEILISKRPDRKEYWMQISQVHFMLKQDEKALAVLSLAERSNLLGDETDVIYLSSLYSNSELPYKAAWVLETGIQDGRVAPSQANWTLVADAWYAAEELDKSLKAYEKAGEAAEDGEIDLRRGYILIDLERWQAALQSLNEALRKGGLGERKMGEAFLLRGMAQFNLGDLDGAGADWERAQQYERTRDAASQWISHLQDERRRRAS